MRFTDALSALAEMKEDARVLRYAALGAGVAVTALALFSVWLFTLGHIDQLTSIDTP